MARRRKKNPSAAKVAGLVLLGVAGVTAAVGLPVYLFWRKGNKMMDEAEEEWDREHPLPEPSLGDEGPVVEPPKPEDGVLSPTKLIGFQKDALGNLIPGDSTPPGIYFVTKDDFVFVPGEEGSQQLKWVIQKATVEAAAYVSGDPVSSDPIALADEFFEKFWPEIAMPPSAEASERVKQLFLAITFTLGKLIIEGGGSVLGTDNMEDAMTMLAAKLSGMGLPDYDPSVVPEIDPFSEDTSDDEVIPPEDDEPEGTIPKPPPFDPGLGLGIG